MRADTPRVSWASVALLVALLAAHVSARYVLGWGASPGWQALHVAVGLAYVAAALTLLEGRAVWRRVDRSAWAVIAVGVACYLAYWYWGRADTYYSAVARVVPPSGPLGPIYGFVYLSLCGLLFRLVLPFTVGARLVGRRARDLGLAANAPPVARMRWVYLGLFALVLPALVAASQGEAFLRYYPLARPMIGMDGTIAWEHFVAYQAFYALVFVSGEALYRGFFAFGLERQLGLYGIAVMLVPYVCSHFGKPFAEALGAIAAGSLLAFLALKHRTIWLGVALHYAVALTLDALAIAGNGYALR